jgi:hypothetical protein
VRVCSCDKNHEGILTWDLGLSKFRKCLIRGGKGQFAEYSSSIGVPSTVVINYLCLIRYLNRFTHFYEVLKFNFIGS